MTNVFGNTITLVSINGQFLWHVETNYLKLKKHFLFPLRMSIYQLWIKGMGEDERCHWWIMVLTNTEQCLWLMKGERKKGTVGWRRPIGEGRGGGGWEEWRDEGRGGVVTITRQLVTGSSICRWSVSISSLLNSTRSFTAVRHASRCQFKRIDRSPVCWPGFICLFYFYMYHLTVISSVERQ